MTAYTLKFLVHYTSSQLTSIHIQNGIPHTSTSAHPYNSHLGIPTYPNMWFVGFFLSGSFFRSFFLSLARVVPTSHNETGPCRTVKFQNLNIWRFWGAHGKTACDLYEVWCSVSMCFNILVDYLITLDLRNLLHASCVLVAAVCSSVCLHCGAKTIGLQKLPLPQHVTSNLHIHTCALDESTQTCINHLGWNASCRQGLTTYILMRKCAQNSIYINVKSPLRFYLDPHAVL